MVSREHRNRLERERRARNPERLAEINRRYYLKHIKEKAERRRKYYLEHIEEENKRGREYHKTINGRLRRCFGCMKRRCENPKSAKYKDYGGRGIKIKFTSSDEFVDYVINVLKVDPRGLQIDRIDNNGHYEPGNIRFTTSKVNNNNKRNNKAEIRR